MGESGEASRVSCSALLFAFALLCFVGLDDDAFGLGVMGRGLRDRMDGWGVEGWRRCFVFI